MQGNKQTNKRRETNKQTNAGKQTNKQTNAGRKTNKFSKQTRETNKQTNAGKQTNKQTGKETNKQTTQQRLKGCLTWTLAPLYLMTPGTVVRVVNSYAATSEYTPARLVRRVDLPTEGNPVINQFKIK